MQLNKIKESFRNPVIRIVSAVFLGAFASVMDIIFHLPGEGSFVFFYFFRSLLFFFYIYLIDLSMAETCSGCNGV